MQRWVILLSFFMSGFIGAMQEGMWDEHGNYMGPLYQTDIEQSYMNNAQVMMVPQLVYTPVYVGPDGQQIPLMPPTMHQPVPPHHLVPMAQQFNMVPPFSLMYPEQQPVPAPHYFHDSGQWAAPAAEQQPQQSLVVSSDGDAHEVEQITQRIEQTSIHNSSEQEPTAHWADAQDSPSPQSGVIVDFKDDQSIPSMQSSSSSFSTPSVVSPQPMASDQTKPTIMSYLEIAKQKKNNGAGGQRSSGNSTSSLSPNKSKKSTDERLVDAIAGWSSSKTNQVQQLTQNKFDWINTLRQESDRGDEWEKLVQLFERSNELSQVATSEKATSLMYLAGTLVANAEKIDKKSPARKRFAQVALQWVNSAAPLLWDRLVEHASRISDQAQALLPAPKKKVEDQTDIPADEFYEGYKVTVAEAAIRSDGKVLSAMVGRTEPEGNAKQEKKETPKKNVVLPVKAAAKVSSKQRKKGGAAPSPVMQKAPQEQAVLPLEERIEKLLNGNRAEIKEGLALLEQVAEGKIPDVDSAYQVTAKRMVGSYYIYGYADRHNPNVLVIEQDRERAHYFIEKAVATGDVHALADMLQLAFEQHRETVDSYADQLERHKDADDLLKNAASAYRAAARLLNDEQGQLAGEALDLFKRMHDHFSFNKSMGDIANILPKSFYTWAHAHIPEWEMRLSRADDVQSTTSAAMAEWLYLMGRLHIEGSAQFFGQNDDHAIRWIKAAAQHGNPRASLFLATPALDGNTRNNLSVYTRMDYLRDARKKLEHCNQAEQDQVVRLFKEYGYQGFLEPLSDYLVGSEPNLDVVLQELEQQFPKIRIPHTTLNTYNFAKASGLVDQLAQRAPDNWVARALLSALEISAFRDHETLPSVNDLVKIDSALERIANDAKKYPQLNAVMAAGFSTRAFVLKRLATYESADLTQRTAYMKQAAEDFKQSIKMGDPFGKISYGMILLTSHGDAFGAGHLDKEGVAILDELASNAEDGGHKVTVLDYLARHFFSEYNWDRAEDYAQKAHALAKRNHQYEYVGRLRELQEQINQGRKRPKMSRMQIFKRKQKEAEQARAVAESIKNFRLADSHISVAYQEARGNPFKACASLNMMHSYGLKQMFTQHPRMIAHCCMAIDDIREAASDPFMANNPRIKQNLLNNIVPIEQDMVWAMLIFDKERTKPGHQEVQFEHLLCKYLQVYHLKANMNNIIKMVPAAQLRGALSNLLKGIPNAHELMENVDVNNIPVDELGGYIAKAIDASLHQARARYEHAVLRNENA